MKVPAVFLDRDGTLNEEMGYINDLSRLKLLPNVAEALKLLKNHGFKLIVVTNQSGPARGYFPKELVFKTNELLQKKLKKRGISIDDFFICFHHPDENCSCRKPKPGLIKQALEKYPIELKKSYLIGDKIIDIETAQNIGIKGILVLTGYGKGELKYVAPKKKVKPYFVAKDLKEAAEFIIKDCFQEK
ncbi:MAG: Histidinol phosphatase/D-glycero-mannoheptose bisphosphatephosphatase [Thermodesulfobacterium sp.]|uniref:D,D-heptose 1,7-bisphosphate phosphatase n=1 Tax=Candidatus Thermodesulfobacterium syntrophicum TaxID=3060442 RepID=A0AAE3TFM8_9BACT|nr:Histidinol phosphatase/D-glycero-mannoheptose bisphosphatephosphatase [Candidatus Thermodesulfobacterium syntrophicum]